MNAVAIPEEKTPVTVVVEVQGMRWSDVLAVRFTDAGQVKDLLCLAKWLRQQEDRFPRERVGCCLSPYALSATVDLPAACNWTVFEPYEPGDIPDGGTILRGPVIEPDAAEDSWSTGFTVRSDGYLIITGEHSAWVEIDLAAIWGQLR